MEEAPTLDEYRTGYIAARWNLPDNAAKALQLFEIGFTVSGAANHLPVTEGTVSKYHDKLMETINPKVVWPVTPSKPRFDVFGERDGDRYAQGKADGKASRMEDENTQVTTRQEQLDPEFRERQKPLNKGMPLEEIPNELITLDIDVEA